eukprot:4970638-Prymnesium_polylepis.1
MVVRGRGRAAQRHAAAASGRKSRATKPAAGMPPGMSEPIWCSSWTIRCGRAFDCAQCGELALWQSAHCDNCMVTEG